MASYQANEPNVVHIPFVNIMDSYGIKMTENNLNSFNFWMSSPWQISITLYVHATHWLLQKSAIWYFRPPRL